MFYDGYCQKSGVKLFAKQNLQKLQFWSKMKWSKMMSVKNFNFSHTDQVYYLLQIRFQKITNLIIFYFQKVKVFKHFKKKIIKILCHLYQQTRDAFKNTINAYLFSIVQTDSKINEIIQSADYLRSFFYKFSKLFEFTKNDVKTRSWMNYRQKFLII